MPAKKNTKVHLHKRDLVATMPSVRQLVLDSMREKKLTAYGLAKLVAPKLTEQTIQNFLNGGDMKASTLDVLMPVLGLKLIRTSDGIPDTKARGSNKTRRSRM